MKILLLSGGSGKRLWPLSNDIRSKQFLKVMKSGNGETESMLQRVYRQIKESGYGEDITIATSAAQVESIRGQLGERLSIVIEPERRDTYPAIALAAAYLYFEKKCSLDETVIVLPVDPYVGKEYFHLLYKLDEAVQTGMSDIVLMGVHPTYPSEKYGYIIPVNERVDWINNILPVYSFKEKPDICMARDFIERGGLWNCGVFAFKLSYLMNIVQSNIVCNSYEDILYRYRDLDKISFDYAVVEKARSVAVAAYEGEWRDLGTWNTLTEVMNEEPIGDAIVSEDCRNTHVINELKIPVVVMGASNMVVVASPDGILVSDKEKSSYIKKYIKDRDLRPMYEERSWGEYTVLNLSLDACGNRTVTKKKTIQEGKCIEETKHLHHLEVWTVLSGRAVISIKGRKHDAFAGDTFTIEKGVLHSLRAEEDTVLLEVQIEQKI